MLARFWGWLLYEIGDETAIRDLVAIGLLFGIPITASFGLAGGIIVALTIGPTLALTWGGIEGDAIFGLICGAVVVFSALAGTAATLLLIRIVG